MGPAAGCAAALIRPTRVEVGRATLSIIRSARDQAYFSSWAVRKRLAPGILLVGVVPDSHRARRLDELIDYTRRRLGAQRSVVAERKQAIPFFHPLEKILRLGAHEDVEIRVAVFVAEWYSSCV